MEQNQRQEIDIDSLIYSAIDLFASAYGWTPEETLNQVYPEDIEEYQTRIFKRQLREYKMKLLITHTAEPKKINEQFNQQLHYADHYEYHEETDHAGIRKLKNLLQKKSKAIKIK